MRPRKSAETTKLTASTSTAAGAPRTPISTPATPGPPVCEAARLSCSFAFPSTSCSFRTSDGQVRLVRDIEEDGADAVDEADCVELPHRQRVQRVGERHGGQRDRAHEVRRDEDRPAGEAVDPDARGEGEEDERQEQERAEGGDLERARLQDGDRDERKREVRDLGAEAADRLGRPQLEEVAVAPEALGLLLRLDAGHLRRSPRPRERARRLR